MEFIVLKLVYAQAMAVFEDTEASEEVVLETMHNLRELVDGPNADKVLDAYDYWVAAFEETLKVGTDPDALGELEPCVRKHLVRDHVHIQSPYNIAQGAMKATIHLMWRRHYAIATKSTGTGTLEERICMFADYLSRLS